MKKIAVIVAGGNGSRMNTAVPKQFLLLNGRPILYYTINTFLQSYNEINIILVLPKDHIAEGKTLINSYFNDKTIQLTEGGVTRFHSVQSGLKLIEDKSVILVHDGVRCMLSVDLIHRCYEAALEFGSAIPVVDSKESLRVVKDGSDEPIDRDTIKQVQTPQTFQSEILLPAYKAEYKTKFTDEASVVESFGLKIHLVKGEENNIKITQPIDLLIAERLLTSSGFKKPD
jgi:2-C-methyl-D-erythritol 4-phosphate cytidylyltransferase